MTTLSESTPSICHLSMDIFRYLYKAMELRLEAGVEAHQAVGMEGESRRSLPVYRSLEWWCLLHGSYKKKILWDFILYSSRR